MSDTRERQQRPAPPSSDAAATSQRTCTTSWRPAHIHFSLFGTDFTQRIITEMYRPGPDSAGPPEADGS